ncbi:uncharacterized protein M421DRAFT_253 [Didymella exigua CBS 183.55]|uniref:SnoaL-like domain-containing protein n=1 Tax=Didymella exigua CBS 183.55 TaxID=1150837 RepID=A0A6A5S048_9PLEO|nr:uncharacterized protein M421DRAFT_253 [Didymella exigua CBS 183.55]KAF1934095.1 hypothetical protein M421DRAFT_253 [Didymella exigua CBS 183.55]
MTSKERQTADKLVTAYNAMDVSSIIALRTPDCQRVFLPSTLKHPPQSNAFFKQNLLAISAIFTSFKIAVDDVIEGTSSDGSKRIVMYVSAFGESPVGEYKNQYVWKMGFTEDGELIKEWTEFVDVGVARDFYPKLKGEMVKRAAASENEGAAVKSQVKKGDELRQATREHYMGMQGGEGGVR